MASAAYGGGPGFISLALDDCLPDGGLSSKTFNCGTASLTEYVIWTHEVNFPQSQFVGAEIVLDLEDDSNPGAMGAWWQWDGTGCRTTAVASALADAASAPGFSFTTCQDIASLATGTPLAQVLLIQRPSPGTGLGPNTQRIKVGWVLPSSSPFALSAGTPYCAGVLRIRSLGGEHASCAGCTDAMTITFNSIWSRQLPGAPNGDLFISDPLVVPAASGGPVTQWTNCVGINQAHSACDGTTPTVTRTWGQIKSLYR
jgi:hypothetical protein